MDCSPPGSSVHGIFQARVLEWGAVAFSVNQRHIQLVKKRGNVKALDEELYSKWKTCQMRVKIAYYC